MGMTQQLTDWREIAEQASKEMNPDKLMGLVEQLNLALAQNNIIKKGFRAQASA
jgi:hypothetical protein